MPTLKPKRPKRQAPPSPSNKPAYTRQTALAHAALTVSEQGGTVHDAVRMANLIYPSKIAKGEIQYWLMKNNKPYLDEIVMGVRTKVT